MLYNSVAAQAFYGPVNSPDVVSCLLFVAKVEVCQSCLPLHMTQLADALLRCFHKCQCDRFVMHADQGITATLYAADMQARLAHY